jgi:hypothetical protein
MNLSGNGTSHLWSALLPHQPAKPIHQPRHHPTNPKPQAVATTVNLHIEALIGLPRTLGRRRSPLQIGVTAVETISKQRGATTRALDVAPGSRLVAVRETIKVELPRKEGMIRLEVGFVPFCVVWGGFWGLLLGWGLLAGKW